MYKDWVIPAGVSGSTGQDLGGCVSTDQLQTPVSQSNYFVHMDPVLFPEPETFDPERWVRAAEKGEHLSRFIVAFTKGSRQCLGIK